MCWQHGKGRTRADGGAVRYNSLCLAGDPHHDILPRESDAVPDSQNHLHAYAQAVVTKCHLCTAKGKTQPLCEGWKSSHGSWIRPHTSWINNQDMLSYSISSQH
eukprot:5771459-Amphidinium_carterae.2